MNVRLRWIGRRLLNADELAMWARTQGFADIVPSAWHVTTGWAPKDYPELISTPLTLSPDSHRTVENFGGLVVLRIRSQALMRACRRLIPATEKRCSIRPHVSFTPYKGQRLEEVHPFAGKLHFGPETQEDF